MEGSQALSSVPDGVLRDDAGASLAVADESFFGRERMIPAAPNFGALGTPVRVYSGGSGTFSVIFGATSATFEMWTDERGLDAIIGALLAAKVRASA